ncbi:hypothetical protein HOY34_19215 [Xinfangfangia sp. D13-10-4-6]|uniref:hypothetical protein n=1 Tax=Pseudogemmobacter hezensis TaxID=2737662 RepID=UPI0015538230|nr:hypothetical protein [Pseudogemmobacter hezensis]NPD17319.1 hypothetical protein [Pseudogemmobacter hezensis]
MPVDTTTITTPAATSATDHGTVTIEYRGLTIPVGFDIHAETPVEQKAELIRMAALQCASDFFDAYRGGEAEVVEGEAA